MKKLLLIAAILAIGTTAAAVSDGFSANGFDDDMYSFSATLNNDAGHAGGIGNIREITTGDNQVDQQAIFYIFGHSVNIFRDKGGGWEDEAETLVKLNVLKPVQIESEVDILYTEAVVGDELQIGDIGFRVYGEGKTQISFAFTGDVFDLPGEVTVKGHNGFYGEQRRDLLPGTETASRTLYVYGEKEIEVDIYFDKLENPGLKYGKIIATAKYQ